MIVLSTHDYIVLSKLSTHDYIVLSKYDYRPYVRKITNDRQIMFDCDKVILHYYVSILRESGLNLMLTLTLFKFVMCNDKLISHYGHIIGFRF